MFTRFYSCSEKNQIIDKDIDIENMALVSEDTEDFTDNIVRKITLDDLIHQLEPIEKTVIILRFYNDLTIKQVSEILEMPLGTVKTTLYRALKKLRNDIMEG